MVIRFPATRIDFMRQGTENTPTMGVFGFLEVILAFLKLILVALDQAKQPQCSHMVFPNPVSVGVMKTATSWWLRQLALEYKKCLC
jgi:hypothetical protein